MKILKLTIIAAIFTFFAVFQFPAFNTNAQKQPDPKIEAEVVKARNAANGLFEVVKGLLTEQMKSGNYAESAEVCSSIAQEMTKDYAEANEIDIHRVSLKLRNSLNKPDKFEKRQLKSFNRQVAEKKEVSEYYETVKIDGKTFLRYMKPVIIQEMCLKCHGGDAQIPIEVIKLLTEKYPKDMATGYKIGDVRGAISVKIPLENK